MFDRPLSDFHARLRRARFGSDPTPSVAGKVAAFYVDDDNWKGLEQQPVVYRSESGTEMGTVMSVSRQGIGRGTVKLAVRRRVPPGTPEPRMPDRLLLNEVSFEDPGVYLRRIVWFRIGDRPVMGQVTDHIGGVLVVTTEDRHHHPRTTSEVEIAVPQDDDPIEQH